MINLQDHGALCLCPTTACSSRIIILSPRHCRRTSSLQRHNWVDCGAQLAATMCPTRYEDGRPAYVLPQVMYGEGILDPHILVLSDKVITSETDPETPLYRLSRPVTTTNTITLPLPPLSRRPIIAIHRLAPPQPQAIYHLVGPSTAEPRYYLRQNIGMLPGCVFVTPSGSGMLAAYLQPNIGPTDPMLFLQMQTRWLSSDEYNYLDGDGRQLACEEVEADGEERRLVITREVPESVRDVLVGMWCLRVWMGEGAGARGGETGKG